VPIFDPASLKRLREESFLSQEELARSAGLRRATITELELGKHVPRPSTIRRLAKALKVAPQALMKD
jgi:transcriptional regulator with XRE-family HTH domain